MQQLKKPEIIASCNQKGGVGKSTLAAQIAYGLSRLKDKRVLCIDLDPQANLTMAFGKQGKFDRTLSSYQALKNKEIPNVLDLEVNLSLIPTDIELADAEMGFINRGDWQKLLSKALKNFAPETQLGAYDYILIDTPPNLGLLTINALMAADKVIIPVTCDGYALNGLGSLMDTISLMQEENASLKIAGLVASRYDHRRTVDKETVAALKESFEDLLFETKIPESTALKVCNPLGKSIWDYSSGSFAATAMSALCDELLERIEHEQPV